MTGHKWVWKASIGQHVCSKCGRKKTALELGARCGVADHGSLFKMRPGGFRW